MAKNKVLQTFVDIAGSVDPSLQKSVKNAVNTLDKINWKALAVGAAVTGIGIATGKAVIEAGKYLYELGSHFDKASDKIRIGTGATGEALEALNRDFDELYKSVPTTMDNAALAISDYNTRLGLTGDELQKISIKAIQSSKMLDEDLGGVIENSSKMFQQWKIDITDMGDGMDFAFKVSQDTGIGFSDLMNRMQKFGPQLQEMGYNFETASALIGQMEKAGVNTDEVLGAMKKSVGELAKEGISAADGIAFYYQQIKQAGTAAEATALASEIFGSKAGSTMALAIRDGTLAVGELTANLLANDETINKAAEDTYDLAERMQMFKQQAEIALRPLANTLFEQFNKFMPTVQKVIEILAPAIGEVSEILIPLIVLLFDEFIPVFEQILPIIIDLTKNLVGKLIPPILKIVSAVLPALMSILDAITPILDLVIVLLDPILNLFTGLLEPILSLISVAIAPFIKILAILISTILKPLGPIIEFLSAILIDNLGGAIFIVQSIFEGIGPVIEAITGIFSGLINFITAIFAGDWESAWDAVGEIFSSWADYIAAIFKFPINLIIDGINLFTQGLGNIKIPDWVPGIGGKGIDIPIIPKLAEGGFTEGLSFAGEAGVEAVISFDPRFRKENLSYWSQAGEKLGVQMGDNPIENYININNIINITKDLLSTRTEDIKALPQTALYSRMINSDNENYQTLSQYSNVTIVYDFSGLSFAPHIEVKGNSDETTIIKQLRKEEYEFYDYLEELIRRMGEGKYDSENCRVY